MRWAISSLTVMQLLIGAVIVAGIPVIIFELRRGRRRSLEPGEVLWLCQSGFWLLELSIHAAEKMFRTIIELGAPGVFVAVLFQFGILVEAGSRFFRRDLQRF